MTKINLLEISWRISLRRRRYQMILLQLRLAGRRSRFIVAPRGWILWQLKNSTGRT